MNRETRHSSQPPCPGPKLQQFQAHGRPIEFVRLISDRETAAHSHVFEVKIGAIHYALKVVRTYVWSYCAIDQSEQFRYYDLEEDELGLSDCENEDPDLPFQVDPFFAECRAFGRINEKSKNRKLAVECFGYLYISAEREVELWRRFQAGGWARPSEEYDLEVSQRQSFRAVVKQLVPEETTWNARIAKRILRNIKTLNALGVYVFDVRSQNIVGGKLVDFSASWTEPHVLFQTRDDDEVFSRKEEDLVMFDTMMEDLQIQNAPRARPNHEYCKKLRSVAAGLHRV